jgi:hypothetical protein
MNKTRNAGRTPLGAMYQTTFVKPWHDTRAVARAAAKAATDELRERAVTELAQRSRDEARATGASRFIGKPCPRHDSAERYTLDGKCVLCTKERNGVRAGRMRMPEKLRGNIHSIRIPVVGRERNKKQEVAAPVLELDAE